MNVALYFDHHVPEAVANGLRLRGIDVLLAKEDNAEQWRDEAILQRASELDRALYTQDRDFLALADQWVSKGRILPE